MVPLVIISIGQRLLKSIFALKNILFRLNRTKQYATYRWHIYPFDTAKNKKTVVVNEKRRRRRVCVCVCVA